MYIWVKAFHVIAVVAWFAGLFYVFRLFVYHARYRDRPGVPEIHEEMERKLLRYIMRPAMWLSVGLGVWLIALNPALLGAGWLHAKLLFVALLLGYQGLAARTHARFARADYYLSERACRVINEVPTLLLVAIVIAVIVRPF